MQRATHSGEVLSPIRTHNAYHLGDNLIHLHFLRKIALQNPDRQFIHAAQWQYLGQLRELVDDLPNVHLEEFSHHTPSSSIDAWRGSNGFWYRHPDRNDFVGFHLEWFEILARKMGVENPIKNAGQMLFDYPKLANASSSINAEILVINSPPGSGQFHDYNEFALGNLAEKLAIAGHATVITHPLRRVALPKNLFCTYNMTVTDIGRMTVPSPSRPVNCSTILMVSTGPSWPTFNIFNQESIKRRIILIDSERVKLSPNTVHYQHIEQAEAQLKGDGLL